VVKSRALDLRRWETDIRGSISTKLLLLRGLTTRGRGCGDKKKNIRTHLTYRELNNRGKAGHNREVSSPLNESSFAKKRDRPKKKGA